MKHFYLIALLLGGLQIANAQAVYNGSTKHTFTTNHGTIDIGPFNASWGHIYTDRAKFIVNKPFWVQSGILSSYNTANLILQTNGSTRMTLLNSNGNVGIGTSSPSYKLDVEGTATGILRHKSGYFDMLPYDASYDDGSYARIFYDGNNKRIQFWNSDSGTSHTSINVGGLNAYSNIRAFNPGNTSASVHLGWGSNIARIRVGGTGSGASTGLDIQGPGDTSLLRVDGVGDVKSKGSISSVTSLLTYNPDNQGASVALSWWNNTARIRIGGSGTGSTAGLDIQTTGNRSLMRILHNGNVGIGTTTPDAELAVNGNIHTKEVKVDLIGWPDYVFKDDYELPTLQEVEKHIKQRGHLINIPSAKEVEENGVQLGEMNKLLLEKIEELTLYVIALEKQNKEYEERISTIESTLKIALKK